MAQRRRNPAPPSIRAAPIVSHKEAGSGEKLRFGETLVVVEEPFGLMETVPATPLLSVPGAGVMPFGSLNIEK